MINQVDLLVKYINKRPIVMFNKTCISSITDEEYKELRNFIATNRPKNPEYGNWGWEKKLWEPRLEWLNFHINLL